MLKRIVIRFLRGLVAVALPVVLAYIADWLIGLPQELDPKTAGIVGPLLMALGKGLRDKGVKRIPF